MQRFKRVQQNVVKTDGVVNSNHTFHNHLHSFAMKAQTSKNPFEITLVDVVISFRKIQFKRSKLLIVVIAIP
jgi:hypothetical protein